MKLRTQLILAFIVLAVIPLSGLTVYSYLTSVNAFKKAAEAEAMEFSSELERRSERVIQVINEEVDNILKLHYDELISSDESQLSPDTERAMSRFYNDIGSVAPYIRSLEIAVPRKESADGGLEENNKKRSKRPSSMILSFGNTAADVVEAGVPPGDVVDNREPRRPFILRDRPGNSPQFDQAPGQGILPRSPSPGSPDTREYIRELVFNQLSGTQNTEPAPNRDNSSLQLVENKPDLYTPPIDPARPESSYITRNRNFNFDSPLFIGNSNGLLSADINGPMLMKEVMQATMRDGDIPFVLDSEGKVITADENHLTHINNLSLEAGTYTRVDNDSGGWMISTRQNPRSGRTIGILRPISGELRAIRNTALVNSSFGLAACILALLSVYPLSKGFTLQLGELMNGVNHLSKGNLDVTVPVTTKNEFGRLAKAFNQMSVDLKHNQADLLKHERLKKELELCREIQKGLLPNSPLKGNRIELQGVSIPAREVGGDFFNYFPLPENRTALLIGDVSGKGVPAALLMANIQARLQARLPLGKSLSLMAEELDNEIFNSTLPENYLTLFAGIMDYEGKSMEWVNAGHNTQYILRQDGELENLASTGRPLGLLPGGGYTESKTNLEEGDTLFLFTDGLIDAENEKGEFFGEESLEEIFRQQAGRPINDILLTVEKAIRNHCGNTLATDDATMLVLRTG
jgi:serine phosphatase RsbU (regulator of sigma subunit)